MLNKNVTLVKTQIQAAWYKMGLGHRKVIVRLGVIGLIILLFSQRELSFQLKMGLPTATALSNAIEMPDNQQASIISTPINWWDKIKKDKPTIEDELNLANPATAVGAALTESQKKQAAKYSNLGFVLSPHLAKKWGIAKEIVNYKKQKCYY